MQNISYFPHPGVKSNAHSKQTFSALCAQPGEVIGEGGAFNS